MDDMIPSSSQPVSRTRALRRTATRNQETALPSPLPYSPTLGGGRFGSDFLLHEEEEDGLHDGPMTVATAFLTGRTSELAARRTRFLASFKSLRQSTRQSGEAPLPRRAASLPSWGRRPSTALRAPFLATCRSGRRPSLPAPDPVLRTNSRTKIIRAAEFRGDFGLLTCNDSSSLKLSPPGRPFSFNRSFRAAESSSQIDQARGWSIRIDSGSSEPTPRIWITNADAHRQLFRENAQTLELSGGNWKENPSDGKKQRIDTVRPGGYPVLVLSFPCLLERESGTVGAPKIEVPKLLRQAGAFSLSTPCG